ncbi:unnamed protein product [Linum tenue]|uniref:S-protein homolog n=1 Tax=Linum tenue TaxID=586396 RepID=A0AAV0IIN0_9ROSI|nr:unnamed protein product [Linum tenue]
MMMMMRKLVVLAATLLIMAARPSDAFPSTVYIENWMTTDRALSAHCRSRDSDIGEHGLPMGAHLEWSFELDMFDRTLFWCDLAAAGEWLRFDAYKGKDSHKLGSFAHYVVKDDGVYLLDGENEQLKGQWNH